MSKSKWNFFSKKNTELTNIKIRVLNFFIIQTSLNDNFLKRSSKSRASVL